MSSETFLIPIKQNDDLSDIALDELRADLDDHPLNQRFYSDYAYMPGNAKKYSLNRIKTKKSPLMGKKILFFGSSVTFGFGALGESFVDYLWKRDGVAAIKDADSVSHAASYLSRFKDELKEPKPELFAMQISKWNIVSDLKYIVTTAQKEWHCPILLYTNSFFTDPTYDRLVNQMNKLAPKLGITVLDLYHNPEFKNQDNLYMIDEINPTRAGYRDKWLPIFERKLTEIFAN